MSNEIDYAHPTNKLEEVLFDVKLQSIYSDFPPPKDLFSKQVYAPNHKAVVNQSTGEILSVVGNNYKLITNKEALEMGKSLFAHLYPDVNPQEFIPYKVVGPMSKASVHIDLIHKDVNFNVWEQETWLPFLRTTNSYNRAYALGFEIGFVRKLCSNGVLFNKKTMKLKYVHDRKNKFEWMNDLALINSTAEIFKSQSQKLRDYEIEKILLVPLVFQVLNINLELPEEKSVTKKLNNLENLIRKIGQLTDIYFKLTGANAYSALNVMTDLVSHQNDYKNLMGYYFNVRSFYTKPSDWMLDFAQKIDQKPVNMVEYLKNTIIKLEDIKEKTDLDWVLN
ncbi:MAG: DUF932 domain-containing protein [Mariniphaga sp.]